MRKFLLLVLIISITTTFCFSSNYKIKGYIYDTETGFGIPSVQVFLSDSSIGVISDNSGYFSFPNLNKKNSLIFDHVKYHSIIRDINFEKSSEIFNSFYLSSKTLVMDSVIVYGSPYFPGRNEVKFSKFKQILYSKKYRQYKQMLKKGNWSWLELVSYGLWSIIDEDVFGKMWNLKSKSQREQFLQVFWQNNDPTPATVRNELKEEFERRIRYIWTNYSEMDSSGIVANPGKIDSLVEKTSKFIFGSKGFKTESEDRLRPWSKRAPWDGRGEIYLKYGKPTQTHMIDLDHVNWQYSELGEDFSILKYSTNIFGKHITPGELSSDKIKFHANASTNYDSDLLRLQDDFRQNYIDNKTFMYQYKTREEISDLNLTIKDLPNDNQKTLINFKFIPEYFKSIKNETLYSLVSINYTISDQEKRRVIIKDNIPTYKTIKEFDIENLNMSFIVLLDPGDYFLNLKIEDHNSNKFLNKSEPFTIEYKSSSTKFE